MMLRQEPVLVFAAACCATALSISAAAQVCAASAEGPWRCVVMPSSMSIFFAGAGL